MTHLMLPIPDHLYNRARQIAKETSRPVEEVLLRRLEQALSEPLPALLADEQAELDAMAHLSDDLLWTIAREQMPENIQDRMQVLMDRNSLGTISDEEYHELEEFVERGNRLTVRKAQAMSLLMGRGFKITPHDLSPQ